jgi:topoisomerase-4 subunit B
LGFFLHDEDPDRLRYEKIILATDADVDGKSIVALLLGALCYLVPKTVVGGCVWIAYAPLFGQYKKRPAGEFVPVWDEKKLDPNLSTERFKGLGSMDEDEAEKIFFSSARQLRQVHITPETTHEITALVGRGDKKKALLKIRGIISELC